MRIVLSSDIIYGNDHLSLKLQQLGLPSQEENDWMYNLEKDENSILFLTFLVDVFDLS